MLLKMFLKCLFATRKVGTRADIQALRAVAVLSVVIYHIFPTRMIGGFMGVDVFFVISGYLMTQTIWKGINSLEHNGNNPANDNKIKASLSFLFSFYANRIKRLAPAATILLLVIIGAIYFLGSLSLQSATTPQILTSTFFMQNRYLANQAVDYLGADAGTTAVQHFWSLSVAEQFYMVWPLLLLSTGLIGFALRKRNKRKEVSCRHVISDNIALIVVILFTAFSFAYCLYLTYTNPAKAYFVTFARIWELSLGGIIVFIPSMKQRVLRLLFPWLGLVLIAYPVFRWGGADFPGWHALIPTLGTALVIWGGTPFEHTKTFYPEQNRFSVANLSRLRLAQFFGDISYSLYLWHWPLIILVPVFLGVNLGQAGQSFRLIKISILLAAIVFAWASYKLVETPARHYKPKKAAIVKIWAMGILCLAIVFVPANIIKMRTADYTEHIVQKAFERAINPNDIGFGARATQHRKDKGVPDNPYGRVNLDWTKFGSEYVHGTMDSVDIGADLSSSITYNCKENSTTPTNIIGEFGDKNATKTILVLGDSFSKQWYPAIDIAARNLGYKVIAANSIYSNGSLFEMGNEFGETWTYGTGLKISIKRSNDRFYWIRDNLWAKADVVIIGIFPGCFSQTNANPQSLMDAPSKFASTLRDIQKSTGRKAILIQSPPKIVGWSDKRDYMNNFDKVSKNPKALMNLVNDKLIIAGAQDAFIYLKVESLFLDDGGNAHTQIGGVPVYFDAEHINTLYSASAGEYFTKQLSDLIAAK